MYSRVGGELLHEQIELRHWVRVKLITEFSLGSWAIHEKTISNPTKDNKTIQLCNPRAQSEKLVAWGLVFFEMRPDTMWPPTRWSNSELFTFLSGLGLGGTDCGAEGCSCDQEGGGWGFRQSSSVLREKL